MTAWRGRRLAGSQVSSSAVYPYQLTLRIKSSDISRCVKALSAEYFKGTLHSPSLFCATVARDCALRFEVVFIVS